MQIPLETLTAILTSSKLSSLSKAVFAHMVTATAESKGLNVLKLAKLLKATPEAIHAAMVELQSHKLIKPMEADTAVYRTARQRPKRELAGQG